MALNITKAPLLRLAATRSFASNPQAVPVGGSKTYEIKTTKLPNNLVVASADNDAHIARVSVVFRAGTRYESPDNLGATHVLRVAAGLSTKNSSQFAITRNLQEVGAVLTCAVDRELVSYTLESTQDSLERTLPFLAEVATQQCFKPWEITDNIPRLKLELATRTQQARVIDLLHKAAYRRQGLGNSIYISKHQMGRMSTETLQHYASCNLVSNKAALVGLGVDEANLVDFAQCLNLESGKEESTPAQYQGSEIRHDKGGDIAYVAIAGEGGSLRDAKQALSFAILQRALGVGSPIKRGIQNQGLLSKILEKYNRPSAVTALNISYSDTGLFGAMISAQSRDVGNIVQETVALLKSGKIPEADIERGKQQLKAAVMLALEDGNTSIEDIGSQAVLLGSVANGCQIVKAIDGVCVSDVQDAFKQVADSTLSLAARGNLSCVPYLDELK